MKKKGHTRATVRASSMSLRKPTRTTSRQKGETVEEPLNDKRHTAYHEAGHGVIGRVLGMDCGYATIIAGKKGAGHNIVGDPYECSWREIGKVRENKSVFIGRAMTHGWQGIGDRILRQLFGRG
jgi:hypothetical protein